jgi:hypothetical protein
MHDLADFQAAREPARSRCSHARGTGHGIAHQVKPGRWVQGARETMEHPEKNSVHRGSGCNCLSRPARGGMTRDAVEWCQGTSAGGGCSTRVWTRRQRQRDGSAAGGHPRFLGDTYPAILVPHPGADNLPQAHQSRTPRSPDARSCEAWAREKPGAFAGCLARGVGSRDRASGEAGMVGRGALRRERCIRKNADGPLPLVHPSAVPYIPREVSCATPPRTCGTLCCTWRDPPRYPGDAGRKNESAMIPFRGVAGGEPQAHECWRNRPV